jgi:tyrosinase
VVSDKHAQNASYAVYVFIGDFDDTDPCTWANSSNLAGTHAPFTGLGQAGDAPRPTIKVSSTIPLTSLLIEKVLDGELPSMDEDDVQDFLEHNLHWRAARVSCLPAPWRMSQR